MKKSITGLCIAGFCAGAVNGLFGAAGGMVLVPLLTALSSLEEEEIFSASIAIILPICVVTVISTALSDALPFVQAIPYLFGGAVGGFLAGKFSHCIPVIWLHRILGGMILWGGIRYIC